MARRVQSPAAERLELKAGVVENLQALHAHWSRRPRSTADGAGTYGPPFATWLTVLEAGDAVTIPTLFVPADLRLQLGLLLNTTPLVTVTAGGEITPAGRERG